MSNQSILIKPEEFDIKKFKVEANLSKTKSDKTFAKATYDGKRLQMKIPKMFVPFPPSDKFGENAVKLELSFGKPDLRSKELQQLFTVCQQIDAYLTEEIIKNQSSWLGEEDITKATVHKCHYNMIRPFMIAPDSKKPKIKIVDPNKKYPDTIRFKIDDKSQFFLQSANKKDPLKELTWSEIASGSQATAIVECGGCWFPEKKATLSWKVLVAKLFGNVRPGVEDLDDPVEDKESVSEDISGEEELLGNEESVATEATEPEEASSEETNSAPEVATKGPKPRGRARKQ